MTTQIHKFQTMPKASTLWTLTSVFCAFFRLGRRCGHCIAHAPWKDCALRHNHADATSATNVCACLPLAMMGKCIRRNGVVHSKTLTVLYMDKSMQDTRVDTFCSWTVWCHAVQEGGSSSGTLDC
eukprot:1320162-Amphidinium_carterae.1